MEPNTGAQLSVRRRREAVDFFGDWEVSKPLGVATVAMT
jgi:hypothetical protein